MKLWNRSSIFSIIHPILPVPPISPFLKIFSAYMVSFAFYYQALLWEKKKKKSQNTKSLIYVLIAKLNQFFSSLEDIYMLHAFLIMKRLCLFLIKLSTEELGKGACVYNYMNICAELNYHRANVYIFWLNLNPIPLLEIEKFLFYLWCTINIQLVSIYLISVNAYLKSLLPVSLFEFVISSLTWESL